MACVRLSSGREVFTPEDFTRWHAQLEPREGASFDILRQDLAKQMQLRHFRRLSLVCRDHVLGRDWSWTAESLVAVLRPFAEPTAEAEAELFAAARSGNCEGLEHLLDTPHDPDWVDSRTGCTLLHDAATQEVVICLLEAGADRDKACNEGLTPLHFAAGSGNLKKVRCVSLHHSRPFDLLLFLSY